MTFGIRGRDYRTFWSRPEATWWSTEVMGRPPGAPQLDGREWGRPKGLHRLPPRPVPRLRCPAVQGLVQEREGQDHRSEASERHGRALFAAHGVPDSSSGYFPKKLAAPLKHLFGEAHPSGRSENVCWRRGHVPEHRTCSPGLVTRDPLLWMLPGGLTQ